MILNACIIFIIFIWSNSDEPKETSDVTGWDARDGQTFACHDSHVIYSRYNRKAAATETNSPGHPAGQSQHQPTGEIYRNLMVRN